MLRIKYVFLAAVLTSLVVHADRNLRDPEDNYYPPSQEELISFESNFPVLDYAPEEAPEEAPRKPKACWKDGEPRGRGKLPDRSTKECPENQEKSMGLCYPRCGEKRIGFGPLCVDDCKATEYKATSILFCCESDELCSELMNDVSSTLPRALAQLAMDIAKNPNDFAKVMRDFRAFLASTLRLRLPLCSKVTNPFFDEVELIEEQVAELTEEEHEEAEVSTGEIIEDFAQETQDADPNPLVSVS